MKELYVANIKIDPWFLEPGVIGKSALKEHEKLILKVREDNTDFSIPYLALFPGGKLQIPTDSYGSGIIGGIDKGVIIYRGNDCPLEDYIEVLASGEDTLGMGKKTPITGIVEFSNKVLYPKVMEKLAEKYEIKRIFYA
jgi:hypothetical protein